MNKAKMFQYCIFTMLASLTSLAVDTWDLSVSKFWDTGIPCLSTLTPSSPVPAG